MGSRVTIKPAHSEVPRLGGLKQKKSSKAQKGIIYISYVLFPLASEPSMNIILIYRKWSIERFKILQYHSKQKLYLQNVKLHQVENMQKGLSFKRPMFEDNAEVSTSVIRTFKNKLILFGSFHQRT